MIDKLELKVDKAIICCKNFHARRCLMFFQFAMPEVEFFIVSNPFYEQGILINKENWYKTEVGQARVMGEVLRLSNQFKDEMNEYLEDS